MTPPHIVLLDDNTLNPGDLSWEPLEALGRFVHYDRTPESQIIPRALPAEILLTNKTPLSAATIAQLPRLRYIGVCATGFNVVDVAAARARGIPVTNVPEYGTDAIAQHAFALLLELTQNMAAHAASVRAGKWVKSPDFCYWDRALIELAGLQLGLVGSGRIGKAVARIAQAFGMKVKFATRAGGRAELENVFRTSDVISLHCPLTADTQSLINVETIGWMKSSALLINVSRGALVNERDLTAALNAGQIAGAGLDVLSSEPPKADNPLLTAKNCVITPHLAWAAQGSRARLLGAGIANVRAFLSGNPTNIVN